MIEPELIRRQRVTEATLDRFRGNRFDWAAGRTCAHLAKWQARAMGHKLPSVPRFRSAIGARRAIAALGAASLIEVFDGLLPPIAPAAMLLGDLAAAEGEGGLDGMVVCAGPGKVMGWHRDAETFTIIDIGPADLSAAWRL